MIPKINVNVEMREFISLLDDKELLRCMKLHESSLKQMLASHGTIQELALELITDLKSPLYAEFSLRRYEVGAGYRK